MSRVIVWLQGGLKKTKTRDTSGPKGGKVSGGGRRGAPGVPGGGGGRAPPPPSGGGGGLAAGTSTSFNVSTILLFENTKYTKPHIYTPYMHPSHTPSIPLNNLLYP